MGKSNTKPSERNSKIPVRFSETMKEKNRGKNLKVPSILALPKDLIVEILAHVAFSSSVDLVNAKLSCKKVYEATEDGCIYQQVSLERFPVVAWFQNQQFSSFLDKCKDSGNPESLCRQGIMEYFSHLQLESGLRCLERAASSGHCLASYTLGVILLCGEDVYEKDKGKNLIGEVKRKGRLGECRKRLRDVLWSIWLKNRSILVPQLNYCPMKNLHQKRDGWSSNSVDVDEDNGIDCQECNCHREIIFVHTLLRGY